MGKSDRDGRAVGGSPVDRRGRFKDHRAGPLAHRLGQDGLMPPTGTYRVQVRPDFPLTATAELADYLADLGVSHLYTAPILTATPGSEHGYDVVDHSRVNPAVGGEEGRLL